MKNGFDLAAFDTKKGAEAGFELQLVSPGDGAPLPIWITILGADSDAYEAAQMVNQRRLYGNLARGKRFNLTPEENKDQALDVLVAATKAWRTDATIDGKAWPAFSPIAVKEFYKRFPAFLEQVKQATEDRANFLPKS
jgi:hypothetical protein